MAWRDASRGQSIVMVVNGALRVLQVLTGILTIIFYVGEKGYWLDHGLPAKINFEFVLGSFSIVTGIILALYPLQFAYRHVALAAPWDFIMFLMYAAAFGYMKDITKKFDTDQFMTNRYNAKLYTSHKLDMYHKVWVNLAGMLLFLASALQGATLLWVGRNNSRAARHSAV